MLSLAVLIIPIVLITWIFTRTPDAPPAEQIDWRPVAAQAAEEAPFAVVAPRAVPETWVAQRVRWTPVGQPGLNGEPAPGDTWQLGFVDDRPMYFGLDQSNAPAGPFIAGATRDGRVTGESSVSGRTWQRYSSSDDRTHALVLTEPDSTIIVSGDVDFGELESFAATLSPVTG